MQIRPCSVVWQFCAGAGRQGSNASRRQFHRERQPVEPGADLCQYRRVVGFNDEAAVCRLSAIDEQLYAFIALHGLHFVNVLASDSQHGSAGDQEAQLRTSAQQSGDKPCSTKYVFEIVQHHEH